MERYREDDPVRIFCEVLEVSVSGYYQWRKRPMNQHGREDVRLVEQVKKAFHANRRVYGSPRIHKDVSEKRLRAS